MPLYQDGRTLLLANALGGLDSDSARAAAFGLVLRHRFPADFILGGYAYGDFQRSADGTAFPRVVAGLEFKTADWDLHVTGYLPLGGAETLGSVAASGASGVLGPGALVIEGDQLLLRHDVIGAVPGADGWRVQEAALYGGEGMVGWRLPLDRTLGDDIDASLYVGGYVFARDGFETHAGPQARLELQLHDLAFMGDGSRLTASLETAWDAPRGLQGAGLLQVRIPLGTLLGGNERHETGRLERRMVDPVQRDLIALTDRRRETLPAPDTLPGGTLDESVRDAETGRTIGLVYFADGEATVSAGSAADPTSLADAVGSKGITGDPGSDALIVVSGEAGSITGAFALAGNQILLGGGSSLDLLGNVTDEAVTFVPTAFNAAASRPTVAHDGTAFQGALDATGVSRVKLVGIDVTSLESMDAVVRYYGVNFTDATDSIARDVSVTGADIAFQIEAESAASSGLLFQDIAATGSGFGMYGFAAVGGGGISDIRIEGATMTALSRPIGASAGFRFEGAGTETLSNLALSDITVSDSDFGGHFIDVFGLTIDSWDGTGRNTSASSSVGLFVNAGSNLALSDFSITDYRAGLQLLSNGTGNTIDGSVRGIFADLGTDAAGSLSGVALISSDVTVDSISISGVGRLVGGGDLALQVSGPATVRLSNIAIDGRNSGGDDVTDSAVFLSGTLATDDIAILPGSSGNSAVNVGTPCTQVMNAASVTGQIVFTAPAATCPP